MLTPSHAQIWIRSKTLKAQNLAIGDSHINFRAKNVLKDAQNWEKENEFAFVDIDVETL